MSEYGMRMIHRQNMRRANEEAKEKAYGEGYRDGLLAKGNGDESIGQVMLWGGDLASIPEDWEIVPGQKTGQVPSGMLRLVYIQRVE